MKKNRFLVLGLCAGLFLAAGCGQPVGTESSVSETSVVESENAAEAEAILSSDQKIPEKLSALSQINGDVYAWLDIPGTNISFPVLQNAQDTGFYLIHNEAGQSDEAGSIYTEYVNSKDFTDNNTVIYGRNVDSRFGRLHQYRDRDFFDSNRTIEIYRPDKTLTYQIFAAYTYDDRHLIASYDFSDETVYNDYLESVFSIRRIDAFIDESAQVSADDRIITLSTGVTDHPEERYLVQAVLTGEGGR